MGEKRSAVRRRALKSAQVIFGNPACVINCTIINLATFGAQIKVASVVGIPDRFKLIETATGERHSAMVMWRRMGGLGVRFEGD